MQETEYCVGCGQKLPPQTWFNIMGKKRFEFEDGDYCMTCAKIKVERDRENL